MERKWLMLALSIFASASYFFAIHSVPPVIPQIMGAFGISYAETGMLMLAVALPAAVLSLPAGVMIVRWGTKRVCSIGFVLAIVGSLATYLADSFPALLIARLVLGSGGILIITSTYSGVSQWFSKEELGRAQGISTTNMPIAILVALNFLPIVAGGYGWKSGFLIATILLIASALAYLSMYQNSSQIRQANVSLRGIRNGQAWLLGSIWGLFVLVYQSFATWAGTFFIELKGMPSSLAFFMASFMTITAIPVSPVAGALSDRVGKRKVFLMAASLGMAVSLLLMPGLSMPLLFLPVLLFSVSVTFLPAILYSLPSEILSPETVGLVYGIMYTCWSIGISTGPTFIGYIRDTFAGEFPIYLALAAFSFLAFVCASRLKTR